MNQARRQDLAAGGAKNHGRGPHFLNTILDVCTNRGAKHEWGTGFKWGAGCHWPPTGGGPGMKPCVYTYVQRGRARLNVAVTHVYQIGSFAAKFQKFGRILGWLAVRFLDWPFGFF